MGEDGGTLRAVLAAPAIGLVAQLGLLALLAVTIDLGGIGLGVGVACAAVIAYLLARALRRGRASGLSVASWLTLVRATLAVAVAAIVADAFVDPPSVVVLVGLAAVALLLDTVDGRVARRTGAATALGARFDGEVDAFLILSLSVHVARSVGVWALAIGLARYVFLIGEWLFPWMRAQLPPRTWRRVAAAIQGIVLTVAAADVLPALAIRIAVAAALAILAESFGRDTIWLVRRRRERPPVTAPPTPAASVPHRVGAALLAFVALIVVWAALVAPNDRTALTVDAFARIPLEGVAAVAAALVLPRPARRLLAAVAGMLVGALVLLKVLDAAFLATFDRPFNPIDDWSYAGIGIETLRDSFGRRPADLAIAGALLGVLVVFAVGVAAVQRLAAVASRRPRGARTLVALATAAWVAAAALGLETAARPVATTDATGLVVAKVEAARAAFVGHTQFAREIDDDAYRTTAGDRLLTGLRGKDVLIVFVEAYGQVALEHPQIGRDVSAGVDDGTRRLEAAGFQARSGYLSSPTAGGLSWLAHATLQAGVWVDSQRRYDQLVTSRRVTLSQAFRRAGFRTVGHVISNNRDWPEGRTFYRYDAIHDRRDVGYRGPRYAYAAMPDQYSLLALERLELATRPRPPLFAEVDLVSSHQPWTRIPPLIDWDDVGDGAIFRRLPIDESTRTALWNDPAKARAAYGRSIAYSLAALVSFVERYGDDDLVLVVLGDHQPLPIVAGAHANHSVPISIVAHDPAVLERIADWGWQPGLRPARDAPLWPMSAFRDRFLAAFSTPPA